ncbi:hypothetical protein SCLCIDRAFT_20244 [Scleroderma citrinum Foug A]|uniref:Uncharacterized protein n=1 Tax=Scleroderma citrinum Foug A TaxID=1036808 RepID=A0A0C3ATQ1_9AGAM|nr:hypothetical protein SCLCIDRAFT_20244 [Scleroderma citrinum Foug A]
MVPGDIFTPFTNLSCGLLMAWQYSGTNQKSAVELDQLAKIQMDPLYDSKDLADPELSASFHTTPYTQHWKTADHRTIDIFSESFASPEMIDAYKEINALPREPGDDLECVVAGLMVWSDSTHLTNFGDASMWPFYLFLANQSKYARCKPSAWACHHVAYILTLPDNFQEIYMSHFGKPATGETYTHCKRELYQGVWDLLLDKKFMHAYRYSADYPEKQVIYLSACSCPQCLIKKTDLPKMGMSRNMRRHIRKTQVDDDIRRRHIAAAHRLIFEKGVSVDGDRVKALLNEFSYVPTYNAFSDCLHEFGVNFFKLLLVDLLHEFELGVWKAIFTHLLRILYAASGQGIQELNKSYCAVPPLGRGTIHKFNRNAFAMKRLAARNF